MRPTVFAKIHELANTSSNNSPHDPINNHKSLAWSACGKNYEVAHRAFDYSYEVDKIVQITWIK